MIELSLKSLGPCRAEEWLQHMFVLCSYNKNSHFLVSQCIRSTQNCFKKIMKGALETSGHPKPPHVLKKLFSCQQFIIQRQRAGDGGHRYFRDQCGCTHKHKHTPSNEAYAQRNTSPQHFMSHTSPTWTNQYTVYTWIRCTGLDLQVSATAEWFIRFPFLCHSGLVMQQFNTNQAVSQLVLLSISRLSFYVLQNTLRYAPVRTCLLKERIDCACVH